MNTLIRLYFIECQDNCVIPHINSKYINESFLAFPSTAYVSKVQFLKRKEKREIASGCKGRFPLLHKINKERVYVPPFFARSRPVFSADFISKKQFACNTVLLYFQYLSSEIIVF